MSKKTRRFATAAVCLLAIGAIALLYLLPASTLPPSLLTMLHREQPSYSFSQAPIFDEVEELLGTSNVKQAKELIARERRNARDSVEYYQYEVLQSKCYYTAMQVDSFYASHLQLKQFLNRQHDTGDNRLKVLRTEEMMQRGVYESKITNRMDTAIVYFQKALELMQQTPDNKHNELIALTNTADAYKWLGKFDKSVYYYRRAMELDDSTSSNANAQLTISIGIASAYTAMGSFEESDRWWKRVDEMRPMMSKTDLFIYLNNRGNDYYLQEKYDQSLKYFQELDTLTRQNPDMHWERMFCMANMSDIYIKLGKPALAQPLIDETEPFFRKEHMAIPVYYLNTQRIEMALLNGDIAEASRLAQQDKDTYMPIPDQRLFRQRVLMKLYEKQDNWKLFNQALKTVRQLHDSLTNDKNRMLFSEVIMRHQHEKLIMEKQKMIEEKELSLRWTVILLIAAVVVCVLIVIISKQKLHERELKEQSLRGHIANLRMENVRNRITPHFISNALTAEILAQMDGKEVNLDPLVQLLHRGTEMAGTEQTTLSKELEFIRFYCSIESRVIGPDFALKTELADDVDPQKVQLPSMFLQILVENSLKHGLKPKPRVPGKERTVLIKATRKDAGTQLEVIDNGVGMLSSKNYQANTGLQVVIQTIMLLNEQNKQQMLFSLYNYKHSDSGSGCRATLYLPDNFKYVIT